jgi:putative spermidine/putrescine transport system ATP-binding protein
MPDTYGATLRLESLVKRYGAHLAVDDVSLTAGPGEFVTLLGPSGSGKTTTLNMIAGFTQVDSGSILLDNRPIARLPSFRRNLGMVFQHYALFPHLTVEGNIAFPLRQRRVPKSERPRRIAEVLNQVSLEGFEARYPSELSGGEQQRVALARAIVFRPRLLLMDEPLGALDKKLRQALQQQIKQLHRELGITFIYVTHDQDEALLLSDRIAVLSEGKVQQIGTGQELYERPESIFVAEFLGDANRFRGRFEDAEQGPVCVSDSYCVRVGTQERGVSTGDLAIVVVRPESMRVCGKGEPTPGSGDNRLGGTVEDASYLGAHVQITVRSTAGDLYVARQPSGVARVERGDEVVLGWGRSDSMLFPAPHNDHAEMRNESSHLHPGP